MRLVDGATVWRWHAQDGFPLELSIPMLADRGAVPTWDGLFRGAKADGANLDRLRRRVEEAVWDGYEPSVAAEIVGRLPQLVASL